MKKLPIIPMTVSFFLKRSKDKKKGIRDAWTYGASIVVIYVALGLAITLIFSFSQPFAYPLQLSTTFPSGEINTKWGIPLTP